MTSGVYENLFLLRKILIRHFQLILDNNSVFLILEERGVMNYVIRKILNDVTTLILCLKQLHLNMKKYEKDLF